MTFRKEFVESLGIPKELQSKFGGQSYRHRQGKALNQSPLEELPMNNIKLNEIFDG
jgi:hypothetical protein